MKNLTIKTLGAIALTAMVSTAGAATFDFVAMADTNTDANYQGEKGFEALIVSVDGITLTATGTDTADYETYLSDTLGYQGALDNEYAYLDSGTAGLGVCTLLNSPSSAQCNPSSDDNATADEVLSLEFGTEVTIEDIFFRDANHNTYGDTVDDFSLFIDGEYEGTFAYGSPLLGSFTGTLFGFSADDFNTETGMFTADGDEFYISSANVSAVPVPAAVWLLGSALGGLGFMRRKQAKS